MTSAIEKLFGPLEPGGIRGVWSPATSIQAYAQYAQLQTRSLYLFGAISQLGSDEEYEPSLTSETDYMIQALRMLDTISDEPITIYINSVGGSIPAGMALIQTMRDLNSPVNTFVVGEAASMAAVVAVAGDKRFAYPASQWLLHRGKFTAHGDFKDLAISTKKARLDDLTADQVILNFSKIPASKLDKMQDKDKWMGSDEALKWGIVDQIVVPRRGPSETGKWLPDRKRLRAKEEKDEEEGNEGE